MKKTDGGKRGRMGWVGGGGDRVGERTRSDL